MINFLIIECCSNSYESNTHARNFISKLKVGLKKYIYLYKIKLNKLGNSNEFIHFCMYVRQPPSAAQLQLSQLCGLFVCFTNKLRPQPQMNKP